MLAFCLNLKKKKTKNKKRMCICIYIYILLLLIRKETWKGRSQRQGQNFNMSREILKTWSTNSALNSLSNKLQVTSLYYRIWLNHTLFNKLKSVRVLLIVETVRQNLFWPIKFPEMYPNLGIQKFQGFSLGIFEAFFG